VDNVERRDGGDDENWVMDDDAPINLDAAADAVMEVDDGAESYIRLCEDIRKAT